MTDKRHKTGLSDAPSLAPPPCTVPNAPATAHRLRLRNRIAAWVWSSRHHAAAGLALGVLTLLAAISAGPVSSAVQIGGDEHFEVTKALLWAKGHSLYDEVWNDQPPLHTALLVLAFKMFGTSIGVARAVAVAFGLALVLGCWAVVKRCSGALAAYLAAAFLLSAPEVFRLSVSVMLEAPAFGVSLWALWAILNWEEKPHRLWLMLSGILYGAALQIKLTAAVAAPALAAALLLGSRRNEWARGGPQTVRNLLIWVGSGAATFLLLGLLLGGSYTLLWASHFGAGRLTTEALSVAFSPRVILQHTEVVWCGGLGLAFLFWRGEWQRFVVPLVWLATAVGIALTHRPWWSYYYLHFAIPLAWFAGYGVSEALRMAWTSAGAGLYRLPFLARLVAVSLLISLLVTEGGARLAREIEWMRDLPKTQDSALLQEMRRYGPDTRWVYTRFTMYPFHVGLRVVPELAVLPLKRFWSGTMTGERTIEILKARHPEQLLLSTQKPSPPMAELLAAEYSLVYEDVEHRLYVAKALASK